MDHPSTPPLRLLPEIGELPKLTACIEAFAETHGLPMADALAFTLAAEELFANTLNHSETPVTLIEFSLALANGTLLATYIDDASPFDPTERAAPDTTLAAEDRKIGGLGIYLIQRTMTVFRYERTGGHNIVTFGRQTPVD